MSQLSTKVRLPERPCAVPCGSARQQQGRLATTVPTHRHRVRPESVSGLGVRTTPVSQTQVTPWAVDLQGVGHSVSHRVPLRSATGPRDSRRQRGLFAVKMRRFGLPIHCWTGSRGGITPLWTSGVASESVKHHQVVDGDHALLEQNADSRLRLCERRELPRPNVLVVTFVQSHS